MLKEKFAVAKAFIEDKQYSEARSILKTIDHPTAEKWLAKLDEIAPEEVVEGKGDNSTRKISKKYWAIAGVALLVVVGVFYIYSISRNDTYRIIFNICGESGGAKSYCHELANMWANDNDHSDMGEYCVSEYRKNDEALVQCLIDEEAKIISDSIIRDYYRSRNNP